jgi:hypothetical protein
MEKLLSNVRDNLHILPPAEQANKQQHHEFAM